MMVILKRYWHDESAATAIEYGLIAALVAVVIIAALKLIGTRLSTKFNAVSTQLSFNAPTMHDFIGATALC